MRPRTKLQREVFENSECLETPGYKFNYWATTECASHLAFENKTSAFCLDCGNTFDKSLIVRKKVECPHCHSGLKVEQTLKRSFEESYYVAFALRFGEFQVIRYFEVKLQMKKGTNRKFHMSEVLQHWFKFDGESFKHTVIAKQRQWNYYCAGWSGSLEIRNSDNRRYDVQHFKCYSESLFHPVFRKYGITHELQHSTFLEVISKVPYDSKLETLIKAKQWGLLNAGMESSWCIREMWDTIKIIIRNKRTIKIENVRMYMDYLELLKYFRKDIRSPKYIFPKSVKREHDRLVVKKRDRQRKEELQQRIDRMRQEEERYSRVNGHFLGFECAKGKIRINVVQSVKECREIGDLLKHCVYQSNYYSKPQALILTARVNGKHTETIEVNLETEKVVQCQGMNNEVSKYHNEILKLMNANLEKLIAIHKLHGYELLAKAC